MDFSKTKFRASSWGNLMSEPQAKAAKERGDLSKSCQKELIKIYNQVVYGRKTDISTKEIQKGIMVEEDSITLLSRVEKKLFIKNQERLENDWFCGHPDVFTGETIFTADEVHDIKSSWSLDTFMPKLVEEPDFDYICQLQVYYDLTGAKSGSIDYCLVSAPLGQVLDEQKKLLYSMNVISEDSREFKEAAAELERNMIFDDIDYRERVIKHKVDRDDELIQAMKNKVPTLRRWLADFHSKHMNLYPKQQPIGELPVS